MTLPLNKLSLKTMDSKKMESKKIDVVEQDLYSLSRIFGGSDDGFAIDFTTASGLYVDSGATDPVDTDGDLIGYATDESGKGNHFTQGTAANKPQWVEGVGLNALDGVDTLTNTFGAAVSTFTVIIEVELNQTYTTLAAWYQSRVNASNDVSVRKSASGTVQGYNIYAGGAKHITIKSGFTGTSDNTIVYSNDGASPYDISGQFNDETEVTNTRAASASWSTSQNVGFGTVDDTIKRIIFIDRVLSDSEITIAKNMASNGWA